jgi:sensor histidine kinase regulating citrate/malate metabolism
MRRKIKRPYILLLSLPIINGSIGITLLHIIIKYNINLDVSVAILLLGLSFIIVSSTVTYSFSVKLLDAESKYKLIEKQLNCQLEHYKKLEEKRAQFFEAVHDFKNHLYCMHYLHKHNNRDELTDYIEKLLEVSSTGNILDTGNPVIDALISEKISLAKRKDIEIEWELSLPADIKIDYIDFCAILGNSLDNAIEACERITGKKKKKAITLSMDYKNPYVVIAIANTYDRKESKKRKKLASSGFKTQLHGFGLKSIKRAVKKYSGNVMVRKEKGLYHLTIVMAVSQRDTEPSPVSHDTLH